MKANKQNEKFINVSDLLQIMEELKDDLIEDEHLFNSYTSLKFYYYKNLKTVKPQYEHYRQEKAYIEKAFAFLDEYINTVKV